MQHIVEPTSPPLQPEPPPRSRRTALALAAIVGVAAVGATIGIVMSSGGRSHAIDAPCATRQAYADLSSSVRTPEHRQRFVDVLHTATLVGLVCDDAFVAYGVAGGGRVVELVSTDALAEYRPTGPNRDVRESHLSDADRGAVRREVEAGLDQAFAATATDGSMTSSIGALYAAAAEHATDDVDVVLLTDGVNHDNTVDLDRPLTAGDGAAAAELVPVPLIGNRQTTVVGLGQSDATAPPPGTSWLEEVRTFNAALCAKSGAASCRLFTTATVSEVLAAPSKEGGR